MFQVVESKRLTSRYRQRWRGGRVAPWFPRRAVAQQRPSYQPVGQQGQRRPFRACRLEVSRVQTRFPPSCPSRVCFALLPSFSLYPGRPYRWSWRLSSRHPDQHPGLDAISPAREISPQVQPLKFAPPLFPFDVPSYSSKAQHDSNDILTADMGDTTLTYIISINSLPTQSNNKTHFWASVRVKQNEQSRKKKGKRQLVSHQVECRSRCVWMVGADSLCRPVIED